jgi:hypothetical protein
VETETTGSAVTNKTQFAACRDRIGNGRAESQGHEVNDKSTLIFVIEINGKSFLAFNADSQIDAERKAQNPMLRSDLMVFETADGPLWNGEDEIVVREALPAERENWLFVRAHTEPAEGQDDLTLQTYLVDIVNEEDEAAQGNRIWNSLAALGRILQF